jgi:hypothetical protein
MEKQILLELRRIQNLMSYDRSKSNLINEEAYGAEMRQRAIDKEIIGQNAVGGVDPSEMRYPSITLGPQSKQPYPIMFDYPDGLPVMGDWENGQPIVSKFKDGMTSKSFIPSTKYDIKVGPVKSADGSIKENQEYFEKNGIKYCLPVKEFWDLHTKNGWVYKFQNPRNGKTFNIKLELLGEGECNNSGDGKTYSGLQCSQRCMGSNNGWMFNLNGFYETGTGKPYDPQNPEHYDLRSQDDIFWDEWGVYIEIIVGIAVSFAAPYLAAGLVAFFAEGVIATTRMASLVNALSTATYAGGEATWLVILTEIMSEAALLTPMVHNYLSRGDDGNAMLTMAMCLVPFLTELKSVKGFISKGFGSKSLSDSVINKINLNGGFTSLFTKDEAAMREFVDVILTTEEKELFYTGVELIKADNGRVLTDAFAEYMAKNGPTIEAGLAKGTGNAEVDSAYKKFLKTANNQLNPVKGTGLIPSFVRGTIVIGPLVIGFQYGYKKLKEIGLTDEQIDNVQVKINEILNGGSEYANALLELNEACGLGPEIPQELINKTIDEAIKDPKFKELAVRKDDEIKKLLTEETNKVVPELFDENLNFIAKTLIEERKMNSAKILSFSNKVKIWGSLKLLKEMIVQLGYTEPKWDEQKPTSYTDWYFYTQLATNDNQIRGVVKFIGGESGTYQILVGNSSGDDLNFDKMIYPF